MPAPHHILRAMCGTALALCVVAAATSAGAADFDAFKAKGAQALLEEGDRLANSYKSQKWRIKMTVKPTSGEARTMMFRLWQKDRKKRLIRFEEPGPVKGMSVLSRGKSVMYVYSPQTDNVRRVAASAQRQTMLGSNLTYADMATFDYSSAYDASFDDETATHQWLSLKKRGDADVAWETLRVRVDRQKLMVDTVEYYEKAKKLRVLKLDNYAVLDGVPTYQRIEMKTVASGLVTTLDILEQKVDEELPDKLFKKKNLVRGQ